MQAEQGGPRGGRPAALLRRRAPRERAGAPACARGARLLHDHGGRPGRAPEPGDRVGAPARLRGRGRAALLRRAAHGRLGVRRATELVPHGRCARRRALGMRRHRAASIADNVRPGRDRRRGECMPDKPARLASRRLPGATALSTSSATRHGHAAQAHELSEDFIRDAIRKELSEDVVSRGTSCSHPNPPRGDPPRGDPPRGTLSRDGQPDCKCSPRRRTAQHASAHHVGEGHPVSTFGLHHACALQPCRVVGGPG